MKGPQDRRPKNGRYTEEYGEEHSKLLELVPLCVRAGACVLACAFCQISTQ